MASIEGCRDERARIGRVILTSRQQRTRRSGGHHGDGVGRGRQRGLRASRVNEVGAAEPGCLTLRVASHREPVLIALDGIGEAERTADFADELPALVERHGQQRAVAVVMGYRPAHPGYLPYWCVWDLCSLEPIGRPPLDHDALPPIELFEDQAARLPSSSSTDSSAGPRAEQRRGSNPAGSHQSSPMTSPPPGRRVGDGNATGLGALGVMNDMHTGWLLLSPATRRVARP